MKTKTIISMIALFLVVFGHNIGPAQAEDFTIHVPLDFKNIDHRVSKIGIYCYVSEDPKILEGRETTRLGDGNIMIPMPANGNYKETVAVKFNYARSEWNGRAKYWRCAFTFYTTTGQASNPSALEVREWSLPQPGAPLTHAVFGKIP